MEEALEKERFYLDGLFQELARCRGRDGRPRDHPENEPRLHPAFRLHGRGSRRVPDRRPCRPRGRLRSEGIEYTRDLGMGIRLDFESVRRRRDGTEFAPPGAWASRDAERGAGRGLLHLQGPDPREGAAEKAEPGPRDHGTGLGTRPSRSWLPPPR
ncbi:MAG: hypothetical protein M0C28_00175 [Candidatus Moduliflexus flocculans]|nr:hypothetical protein [Candidatus Moduliflexus flocculans]